MRHTNNTEKFIKVKIILKNTKRHFYYQKKIINKRKKSFFFIYGLDYGHESAVAASTCGFFDQSSAAASVPLCLLIPDGATDRPTERWLIDRRELQASERRPPTRPPITKAGARSEFIRFLSTPIRLAHALGKKSSFVRSVHVCALTEWKSRTTTASFISVAWIIFGRSVKNVERCVGVQIFMQFINGFNRNYWAILQ